ncbi:hypothetical protein LCGC14_2634520, partial [marine sediment metagenome]
MHRKRRCVHAERRVRTCVCARAMSVVAVEQLLQYWTDYTNSDQKDAAVQLLRRNAYQWSAEHCTFRASGADELAALNDPKRLPPLFTYADAVQNVSFVVLAKHAYVTGAPDSATLRVVVVPVFDDSANPITLLTYIDHDEDEEEEEKKKKAEMKANNIKTAVLQRQFRKYHQRCVFNGSELIVGFMVPQGK